MAAGGQSAPDLCSWVCPCVAEHHVQIDAHPRGVGSGGELEVVRQVVIAAGGVHP